MVWLLAVVLVGLPLLAWLGDLCLLDAAALRARIEAVIREHDRRDQASNQ